MDGANVGDRVGDLLGNDVGAGVVGPIAGAELGLVEGLPVGEADGVALATPIGAKVRGSVSSSDLMAETTTEPIGESSCRSGRMSFPNGKINRMIFARLAILSSPRTLKTIVNVTTVQSGELEYSQAPLLNVPSIVAFAIGDY